MDSTKRLYIDIGVWGVPTNYVKWQYHLLPMIWNYYDLSKIEERIFIYICMTYDNPNISQLAPIKLSYADIAKVVQCTRGGVQKAIDNLISCNLIQVVGERKGKGKTQYLPNISEIHSLLKKYLKIS